MNLLKNSSLLMLCFLASTMTVFGILAPQTLSLGTFNALAIQLPQLGILTLAMFIPVISGGLNLAITYIANLGGLFAAYLLTTYFSGNNPTFGIIVFALTIIVGGVIGAMIGLVVAYFEAHPILVTLGAMILLRGVMEWITRGGGISGMPEYIQYIGNGTLLDIPIVFWIFITACVLVWFVMHRTSLGFSIYMVGSNPKAAEFSGINVNKIYGWIYALSGGLSALAGLVMLAQNNSMRVDAGKDYMLITLLACFVAGADPFGGFGKVLPVVIALVALQMISSGMNILGANPFLTTALWGVFLIIVMLIRYFSTQKQGA